MRRSHFTLVLLIIGAGLWAIHRGQGQSRTGTPSVTIIATPAIEAHDAAIEGIRAALAKTSVQIRVVDLSASRTATAQPDHFAAPGTRVIIAIGTEALQLVAAERPEVPVISTMVLYKKAGGLGPPTLSPSATVLLDVPAALLLTRLKQIFPGKTRLGIIRNPNTGGPTATALEVRSRQLGFTIRVVDCPAPEQLLAELLALKGQVDFVWCLPDSALYNSVTIKPLILASIENRVPLIGFSESFARAGAAVGVYPDFRDIGLQTGEVAHQIIVGQAVQLSEGPRKLKLAVNQSVLRLLGLRYTSPASTEDFSVLQ